MRDLSVYKRVWEEFGKDNGSMMAAAVAFYLMLSLLPLTLLAISLLGYLLESEQATSQALTFLNQFLPVREQDIRSLLQSLIAERGERGLIGLTGTALAATGGFATLENAINILWDRPNRSFIMNKVVAFVTMLGVGLLFGLSLGITSMVEWASALPALSWLASNWALKILGYLLPLLLTTIMFYLIYRYYPTGRTEWKAPLQAAGLTAVLWELFKIGYTLYLRYGDQNVAALTVGLVMWIYYSCMLVLLGSELTYVLEGCPKKETQECAA